MTRSPLREVAGVFLRLGFTAFGGPVAHLALMEDHVVRRRGWIDRRQLLDMVAAVNFIPGPNSTELAMHLGWVRAGWRGLLVAGACFVLPAALIILPLGWMYVNWGTSFAAIKDGPPSLMAIRAAIVAVVAAATVRFATTATTDPFTALVAALAVGGAVVLPQWGVPQAELILLGLAAVAGIVWNGAASASSPAPPPGRAASLPLLVGAAATAGAGGAAAFTSSSIGAMTLFFLKVGATLFGTGYVLVSYFNAGLVHEHGWMTRTQVLDAIAVGQFTPGPLLTSATFVGYVLGHQAGGTPLAVACAMLATAAIFLPSFCFVAVLSPFWQKLRTTRWLAGALRGMNAAVVGLVIAAALALGREAIVGWWTGAVAAASLGVLIVWNVNSTWLILAAGLGGLLAAGLA
jgi:chromate transporter